MKMWDDKTRTLYYQVDNTQDWDYYGEGDPSSATGNCGGTYVTPYCLITEYDIWILPQAADHFEQSGDPRSCDPVYDFLCLQSSGVRGWAGGIADQPESSGSPGGGFCVVLPAQSQHEPFSR